MLKQYYGIFSQPASYGLSDTDAVARHLYMCGKPCFTRLRGYCRGDDSGTVSVSYVVLHDQYRSHTALLGPYHWRKVCIIYISAPYYSLFIHFKSSPRLQFIPARLFLPARQTIIQNHPKKPCGFSWIPIKKYPVRRICQHGILYTFIFEKEAL